MSFRKSHETNLIFPSLKLRHYSNWPNFALWYISEPCGVCSFLHRGFFYKKAEKKSSGLSSWRAWWGARIPEGFNSFIWSVLLSPSFLFTTFSAQHATERTLKNTRGLAYPSASGSPLLIDGCFQGLCWNEFVCFGLCSEWPTVATHDP